MVVWGGQAFVEEHRRREVKLDVGRVDAVAGADEAGRLGDVRGKRAAAMLEEREVLRRGDPEQRLLVGQVVDLRHAVVLEPVADRQVRAHLDPQRRELVLGADPGQHQQDR